MRTQTELAAAEALALSLHARHPKWTKQRLLKELLEAGKPLSEPTLKRLLERGASSLPPEGVEDTQDTTERTVKVVRRGKRPTVADVLREAGVDERQWKVEKVKANHWEVASKHPTTGAVTTTPLWQVCVWLRAVAQDEVQLQRIVELSVKQIEGAARQWKVPAAPVAAENSGVLLELDVFDAHLGLLSWAMETGVDYDLEIAESSFITAITQLLGLAQVVVRRPDCILLPAGNDFLHVDTERGSTTGGTELDVDTRATRVFERGKLLLVTAIEQALSVAPKVVVPIIPGNHDNLSMFHLGQLLAAWYRGAGTRVEVDYSPRLRKYFQWGKCLLGYTHGGDERRERLPMLMAHEQRRAWSETTHRCWRVGHLHHQRSLLVPIGDTIDGVWVRQSMALAPRDAWHTKKGYIGTPRGATATLWDKERGPTTEFCVTL